MSDDEADPELVALLRQQLMGSLTLNEEPETGVLEGAEDVYDNSIDVALDMRSCKNAAAGIFAQMQEKNYSASSWSEAELHPKTKDESTVAFIFTMDVLNFCFWSEKSEEERFAVSYRDKRWNGYWSLVASLQRALDEGWSSDASSLSILFYFFLSIAVIAKRPSRPNGPKSEKMRGWLALVCAAGRFKGYCPGTGRGLTVMRKASP